MQGGSIGCSQECSQENLCRCSEHSLVLTVVVMTMTVSMKLVPNALSRVSIDSFRKCRTEHSSVDATKIVVSTRNFESVKSIE